jgi:parallel beta-helix repeat protein
VTINGTLYNQYYLNVLVQDDSSNPVNAAIINGSDSAAYTAYNPTSSFNTSTNSSGLITTQILTEFLANATNTTPSSFYYFNNYTVNASKGGYANDSEVVNMSSSQYLILTLSDLTPPQWSSNITSIVSSYSSTNSQFNITWTDNGVVDKAFFESNFSGSPYNYSMAPIATNVYNFNTTLPAGTYYWKSFANDTKNNWNVSYQWNFTILQNTTNLIDIYLTNSTGAYKNQNITEVYGIETTANATMAYSNAGPASLYEDGSSVSNPRTFALSGGTHSYKGNTTGNQNYTANFTGATYYINVIDRTPPIWQNQGTNDTNNVIDQGESINLTAQGKDETALDWSWLATNESGSWRNITFPSEINQSWANLTGLVGLWHLNSINSTNYTLDSSGNNNNGKLYNFSTNPPTTTTGKLGNAIQFDGVNTDINISDTSILRIYPVTVSAWVYPTATMWGDITQKGSNMNPGAWELDESSIGHIIFGYWNGTTNQAYDTGYTLNNNNWYHIVGIIKSYNSTATQILVYANGNQVASNIYNTIPSFTDAGPMVIGGNGRNGYFNGTIDEVSIWNRSLTADEIYELYTRTYKSPMNMTKNNQWQWSNFTWSNSSVPLNTVVGWRIYYNDTSGNENTTDIKAFKIQQCFVTISETGACFTTIQEAINAAVDGQTVVIIQAREFNESVVVNKSVVLTSNTATRPTIFQNIASVPQKTVINVTSGNSTVSNVLVKYNGTGSNTNGITAFQVNNVTIDNVTASVKTTSSNYGIYLYYSNQSTIKNSNSSNNCYGFYLNENSNNTFTSNIANDNLYYGFYIIDNLNNTLTNNTANYNNEGFHLESSSNNIFTNNTINGNINYGIYLYGSSNNTFTNSTANYNYYGFYLDYSSNNIFTNNTITAFHTSSLLNQQGLYVSGTSLSNFRHNISETNTINGYPILYIDGIDRTCANNTVYTNGSSYSYMGFVGCFNMTVRDSSPSDHILLASTTNSTIANVNISFSRIAIYLALDANYNILANNTANNNDHYGFFLYHTSYYNTFTNNTANNNTYYGFFLSYFSYNNTLTNNTANYNNEGFHLYASDNNNLTNNTANSNNYYGFYLSYYNDYNTLTDNIANSNSHHGFYLVDSEHNIFTNNTANNNKNDGFVIYWDSSNNIFTTNTAGGNTNSGFYIYSSSNNNILTNNTVNSNTYGFLLQSSSNNNLTNNTANSNYYGFDLASSSNNNILTNNTANSNTYGFYLFTLSNTNKLTSNTLNQNKRANIFLCGASNNNITSNTLNASAFGILIGHYNSTISCTYSSEANNTIMSDNIISNTALWDIYIRNSSVSGKPVAFSINNTLDKSKMNVTINGTLYNQYYLNVYVQDQNSVAVNNAIVNATDSGTYTSKNPTSSFSQTTNSSGYIPQQTLTEFMANATNSTPSKFFYFSNYTVSADKVGYTNSAQVNMTSSQFITLTLSLQCNVVVNETQNCFASVQDAVNNATNGQTVVVINAREYEEVVLLDKSITLTSNTSTLPTVFQDASTVSQGTIINITSGNSTVSKLNVKYNGTGGYINGITVFMVNNVTINNISASVKTTSNNYGIYLYYSNYSAITNSNSSYNNYGINLEYSNNNTLTNNTANNNLNYGFLLSYSLNSTLSNNIANNNNYGFQLSSASDLGCNILNNNIANDNNYYGFYLVISSNNTLTNNTANGNGYGFYLWTSSNYNIFTNNTANSNNYGFYLKASSNYNTLTGGSIADNIISDFELEDAGTTNNFTNTNFTAARQISFYDTTSWFNYNNETAGSIWLKTSVSAESSITRKLINWNQSLMQWNDSSTDITARYNITGLLTNNHYYIYSDSVLTYKLQTDSNGVLPSFTIYLSSEQEIKVLDVEGEVPKINQIQCEINSTDNWQDCSQALWSSTILRTRVNCTDPQNNISYVTYNLTNIPDSETKFTSSNASSVSGDWWYYDNDDLLIQDSGQWSLLVTCVDKQAYDNTSFANWTVPWGHLESYLINPTSSKNVAQNKFFTFQSGVRCVGGECGNVNGTLDPQGSDSKLLDQRNKVIERGPNYEKVYIDGKQVGGTIYSGQKYFKSKDGTYKEFTEAKEFEIKNRGFEFEGLKIEPYFLTTEGRKENGFNLKPLVKDNVDSYGFGYSFSNDKSIESFGIDIKSDEKISIGKERGCFKKSVKDRFVVFGDYRIDFKDWIEKYDVKFIQKNDNEIQVEVSGFEGEVVNLDPGIDISDDTDDWWIVDPDGGSGYIEILLGGTCGGSYYIGGIRFDISSLSGTITDANITIFNYDISSCCEGNGEGIAVYENELDYNYDDCTSDQATCFNNLEEADGTYLFGFLPSEFDDDWHTYTSSSLKTKLQEDVNADDDYFFVYIRANSTGTDACVWGDSSEGFGTYLNYTISTLSINSLTTSPSPVGINSTTVCQANATGESSITWANFTITDSSNNKIIDNVNGTASGDIWNSSSFTASTSGTWNCSVTASDGSETASDTLLFTPGNKGIVPMNSGNPFYTTSNNPQSCSNMKWGDTCNQTWTVNATGETNTTWEFFSFYNATQYPSYIAGNETSRINITIIIDTTSPLWNDTPGYLGSNTTNPSQGEAVLIYGMGYDETALDWAWLATNETESWENKSVYSSPMNMNDAANQWVWSNFTWSNSSVAEGAAVAWRIYYNDTSGNQNVTNIQTFTIRETTPPKWSSNTTNIVSSYSSNTSQFNITWTDNVAVDKVFIEGNWSGSPTNYSMTPIATNVYNFNNTLPAGNFYWRSFANDSSNNWNASYQWNFTVSKAKPVLILSNNTAAVNTSGLVGYWRFESINSTNGTSDSSGYGNDGVAANFSTNPASTISGWFGRGLQFGNVNNRISVSNSESLNPSYITVEAWIKTGSTGVIQQIATRDDLTGGGQRVWQFRVNTTNKVEFIVFKTDADVDKVGSATTVTDNNWHHVVGTWDGTNIKVYVDGMEDGSKLYSGSLQQGQTSILGIGATYYALGNTWTDNFYGAIDEVQIWNRSLTASEIAELYQSSVTYPTSVTVNATEQNTGDNDLVYTLYRNNTNINSTENGTAMILPVGYHYYLFNTSGGQNWTQSALLLPLNITKGTVQPQLYVNSSSTWSYQYPVATNVSCNVTSQNNEVGCSLARNETIKGTSETSILPVGQYLYRANVSVSANSNYSANATGQTQILAIGFPPGIPTLYLAFNGTTNANAVYSYPAVVNATGYFGGTSEGTVVMWRNGTSLGNGTRVSMNETLGNATWNFTVSYYAQNYTATAITYWVVVNKATATCSVSPTTQSQTYPYSVTQYCTANYGSCKLYRNDSDITTANSTAVIYGVAGYSFIGNLSAAQNYTSCSASSTLTINQNQTNPVNLYFNGTANANRSYVYPSAMNATGAVVYSNSGTVSLYRGNGSAITNAQENILLGNGTYAYKANVTGNQNYTVNASGVTFYALVSKGSVQPQLYVNYSNTWSYQYPNATNVTCNVTSQNNEAGCSLARNEVIKGTSELILLPAGNYVYRSNSSETGNYSVNVTGQTRTLAITQCPNCVTLYLDLNGTTNSNKAYTYPAAVNATGYFSGVSEGTVVLWRNGTNLGNTTSVSSIQSLGNATWNFTVSYYGQNYTASQITYYVFMNKAAPTLSLTGSNVTYPSAVSIQPSKTNSGDSDVNYTFWRNNSLASSAIGSVPTSDTTQLGAGWYNYVLNTSGGANYTSGSTSLGIIVSQNQTNPVNLYFNGTANANRSYVYPSAMNATGAVVYSNSGTVSLYRGNGSAITNAQENILLGNGTYAYKVNITGNQNYTVNASGVTFYALVSKGNVQPTLSVNGTNTWSYTYPTATAVSCSVSQVDGASGPSCSVSRNETVKGTSEITILAAGQYLYRSNSTETGNYTVNSTGQTNVLTINPSGAINLYLDFNGTTNGNRIYTYPAVVNATGYFGGTSEGTVVLWRNGTSLGNATKVSDIETLGNATWNFTVSYYAQNYTATAITYWVFVNEATSNPIDIYLNNGTAYKNQNITAIYGTETTANATMVYSNAGTANLYENDSLVSNPKTTTLFIGTNSYKGNTSGNANYTANFTGASYYIIVICKPPLSGDWTVPAGTNCLCNGERWNVVGDAYIYGSLTLTNNCNITFTPSNRNIYVYSGGNIQIAPGSGFNKPS